jgi:hypothetical protein
MVRVEANYNQCSTVSQLQLVRGSIYFVTVDCSGVQLSPDGQANSQKQVQLQFTSSGAWDPTNDWSFQGIPSNPGAPPVKVNNIVVLDNGTEVSGVMPNR